MTIVKQGLGALSDKEKATLRMIVRGHDAKSIARTLGLSVHTINERLREARRKLNVASSREAARQLFEAEASVVTDPGSVGDTMLGDAAAPLPVDEEAVPLPGTGRRRRPWLTIGVVLMLPALALLALATLAQITPSPPAAEAAPVAADNAAAVDAAQRFLVMIDQQQWSQSYAATGSRFRKVNTLKLWTDTSAHVRAPLGALVARTLLGAETVPAPPRGFQNVRFRSQFANKVVTETVALDHERDGWRVVGIVID